MAFTLAEQDRLTGGSPPGVSFTPGGEFSPCNADGGRPAGQATGSTVPAGAAGAWPPRLRSPRRACGARARRADGMDVTRGAGGPAGRHAGRAALAPLIVALLPGPRVPQVVIFLVGGVIIGPHGLGIADTASIQLLSNIGLVFLFLLAGDERIRPRQQPGRLAIAGWLVARCPVAGPARRGQVLRATIPVGLALTTTAPATPPPILQDNHCSPAGSAATCWPPGRWANCCPRSRSRCSSPSGTTSWRWRRWPWSGSWPWRSPSSPAGRPPGGAAGHQRGPGRHRPDHPALGHRAAVPAAHAGQQVRPRRGAGRAAGGDGAPGLDPSDEDGHHRAGTQVRCGRLRDLHPDLLRGLRDDPGPQGHQPGSAADAHLPGAAAGGARAARAAGLPGCPAAAAAGPDDVHHRHDDAAADRAGRIGLRDDVMLPPRLPPWSAPACCPCSSTRP